MFKITLDGKEFLLSERIKVYDLIDKEDLSLIACIVRNKIRRFEYELYHDNEVKLLTLKDQQGCDVYCNSLRYLFAMAVHNLYPKLEIKFSYSISKSMLCKIINNSIRFNEEMKNEIEKEMRRLIDSKLDLERVVLDKEETKKLYEKLGLYDKVNILKYRPEKTVFLVKCGKYINYVYGPTTMNTKYLSKFKLDMYNNGILLRYPRAENNGEIPELIIEDTYQKTLDKAFKWTRMIKSENIADINSHIETSYDKVNFVHVCEARHNADLTELAQMISDNLSNIKLISIAGPSSSGKTTFSNRLRIQLMTKGINTVKVSIDDYYLDRDLVPKPKDGKVDLEDINILDIKLFNEHLLKLIDGEEVEMPSFDFKTGKRIKGKTLKIEPGTPIIIEGIHALNEILTGSIKRENKFKIYIAPHVQVNIDNLTPIRSTEMRLLRRIVRDNTYRGYDAEQTISLWESVRQGEFKWIYANQEDVDYVFNSDLVYEVNVMKKHALPLLEKVRVESPIRPIALELIRFLKYYEDIEDELVPCNSLLREFIGGSCFQDV